MPAKYLKNMKNGVLLPYSKMLAKNHPHVVPVNSKDEKEFEEVDATEPRHGTVGTDATISGQDPEPVGDTGNEDLDSLDIETATKKQLGAFAQKHYEVDLNLKESIGELRSQVRKLAEEE